MGWIDMITNDFLVLLQGGFPLTPRPFRDLGNHFGLSEQETIALYAQLKEEGIIRQTSAILDTKALGYDSTLVALALDDSDLDRAAAFVNTHPGVSHNYRRDHAYNLWFTLAVPPDSQLGLDGTVQKIVAVTGASAWMSLPTLKMFKIAVKLDTAGTGRTRQRVAAPPRSRVTLMPIHYRLLDLLQADLEAVRYPFATIADQLNIDHEWLFGLIDDLARGGYMRRYATILNHRKAGFAANAMVVWNLAEEETEEAGRRAAEFSAVSHCYERPRYPDWPYNLFTMIHGRTPEELQETIRMIAQELGTDDYRPLVSLHEYKKVRIRYFSPEIGLWERQFLDDDRPIPDAERAC